MRRNHCIIVHQFSLVEVNQSGCAVLLSYWLCRPTTFFQRTLFMKPIQVQSRHSVFGLHLGLFWYSGQKRNPFNPSPDWVSLLAARMAGWLWLVNFISCQIRVWFILDNNPIYIEFWTLIASVCQIQILAEPLPEPLPEPQQCCLWLPVTWYSNDFSDK